MTTLAHKKSKLTWQQVWQSVQMLSPQEQRCLRDELAKSAGVYLARPTGNAVAIRRGRRMAKAIRAELAAALMGSLDEVMTRLREG